MVFLACQGSKLTGPEVVACTDKAPCPCEQDPTQSQCKGFNERPETSVVLPDTGPGFDAADGSSPEASDDAGDDAADADDGSDI